MFAKEMERQLRQKQDQGEDTIISDCPEITTEMAETATIRKGLKSKLPMKYFVRDLRTHIDREISEDKYEESKTIHENLIEVLLIEEKLDIVLCNYFELEKTLLDISLKESIFNYEENQDNFFDELNMIDRTIFNLLASCTMYIDQTAHSFSKIYGKKSNQYILLEGSKDNKGNRIKSGIKSKEYDSNLAYRAMQQIRNHIQHYGLLVNQIKKKGLSIQENNSHFVEHKTEVETKIEPLKRNSRLKESVLKELEDIEGEYFNIVKYIREYLVSIGIIHLEIREILEKDDVNTWDNFFLDLIENCKKETGNDMFSIVARNINSPKIIEKIDLVQDILITRRKKLQEKNNEHHLRSYSTRYVSSKTDKLTPDSK